MPLIVSSTNNNECYYLNYNHCGNRTPNYIVIYYLEPNKTLKLAKYLGKKGNLVKKLEQQ